MLSHKLPGADAQPTGWQIYERAKRMIPGGTQLFSKRPELFLPDGWPCFYQSARGCEVWTLDGRCYTDMTTCGIGSCLLGYADEEVNSAVKSAIDRGTMTTLNSTVDLELAELLCQLHPWASSVRYARTGGEAMAVAVRIARAFTNRSKVAFCGYHGWNDWYIAANIATEDALDGHLLPGLCSAGVPRELAATALPFHYNHLDELRGIAEKHGSDVAAIILEPMRFSQPVGGFLAEVGRIAAQIGAVVIYDEITSAWRHCCGGQHLLLQESPDIAPIHSCIRRLV